MTDPVVDPTAEAAAQDPTNPPEKDWKAEYEKAAADAERLKGHARTWETRAKENQVAAEKQAALEAANLSDLERVQKERDAAIARAEQVEKTVRDRVVNSGVRELAATSNFIDPGDALAVLQVEGRLAAIEVDANGELDRAALQAALADLAARKPHLLVAGTGPQRPQPDSGQGARPASQMSEKDALYEQLFPSKT